MVNHHFVAIDCLGLVFVREDARCVAGQSVFGSLPRVMKTLFLDHVDDVACRQFRRLAAQFLAKLHTPVIQHVADNRRRNGVGERRTRLAHHADHMPITNKRAARTALIDTAGEDDGLRFAADDLALGHRPGAAGAREADDRDRVSGIGPRRRIEPQHRYAVGDVTGEQQSGQPLRVSSFEFDDLCRQRPRPLGEELHLYLGSALHHVGRGHDVRASACQSHDETASFLAATV